MSEIGVKWITDSWRCILWAEAANALTLLKSFIVKSGYEKSACQQFLEMILSSMQKFGKKCIVTKQEKS